MEGRSEGFDVHNVLCNTLKGYHDIRVSQMGKIDATLLKMGHYRDASSIQSMPVESFPLQETALRQSQRSPSQ